MTSAGLTEPSSFRDPDGVVFWQNGVLYRRINPSGQDAYRHLMESGLYAALVQADLLIPHEEAVGSRSDSDGVIIQPERIPFVSYPYEWCFSQLKDAALLTLRLQKEALEFGMSLKDASAYNVQFWNGSRPVFIDTLSFERYDEGEPWAAYRQFCRHFLAPLALMAHTDIRFGRLLQTEMDGIPLDLAARLLPLRDRIDPALLPHIYLHSAAQQRFQETPASSSSDAPQRPAGRMSRNALRGLIDSLEGGIRRLAWQPRGTEWSDYYENTNYDAEAFQTKKRMVARFLSEIMPEPRGVYDLGANTGVFSRVAASERGIPTFAFDVDPAAVEKSYRVCRDLGERSLLPLVQDLVNPSPALGWAHEERRSFLARCGENGPADVALALALVHHLALSNNVPLARIADFMRRIAPTLIIEFVPKEDSQTQRLLSRRKDIFPDYTPAGFEDAFASAGFAVRQRETIPGTQRILYRMQQREDA